MTDPAYCTVRDFPFPPPAPLMNINERRHWSVDRAHAKAWRSAARFHVPTAWERPLPPSVIRCQLPVSTGRRRDPHNYFPTVKHIVDGLVDAGLWPDDTPQYVTTVEPVLIPYPRHELRRFVLVSIADRDDQ